MPDELVAELARLDAARKTLEAIERACVGGIPSGLPSLVAASTIMRAYDTATPQPSPFRTAI